ncbi:hypothetical protein QJS04_geneDACA022385 [Acorus gramineus]|uniref:Uncharacterized protein n=1 Tax=Acorus gramineus TaxID=55184 RepID=A0AAV9B0U4_ACOGR|nr:hypothetical protein QJS04_geneDACA022385 [Acorus gramineus]
MKSLSGLGIGLSLVFGFLFLALIGELYYLFWWKRRIIANNGVDDGGEDLLFCFKKHSSLAASTAALTPQEPRIVTETEHDHHLLKPSEEGVETELMRLHNLHGPPRFLFTIKEETKEDMESEDKSRKGSRGRSLSDVIVATETPFLTPLSSPPFYTPPLTPLDCYSQNKFNPLFESPEGIDWSRVKSSPPPKFKFLKDAEEKLYRKTLMEEAMKKARLRNGEPPNPTLGGADDDGSFITIVIGKSKEKAQQQQQQQHHSSSSQVLPLASSPVKEKHIFR